MTAGEAKAKLDEAAIKATDFGMTCRARLCSGQARRSPAIHFCTESSTAKSR